MISLSTAFALGPAPEGAGGGVNVFTQFLPLILIFLVFYFLLIRPQQKRAKEHKNFLESLQKGNEVVTVGGLIGRIVGLTDQVVTLEVSENVRVKVLRAQIAGPGPSKGEPEKK